MKKIRMIVCFLIIICLVITTKNVHAVTLKEYEDKVAQYTAELKEKEAKKAKSEAEVAEVKKNIQNIENQISQTEKEISNLQAEIEKSNQEIIKKSTESKKVMEYYQIANGNNAYLEYAFGAETINDMIYRMSIVEQLTEYNDKIMKELKQLIAENNKKKTQLSSKKEELKTLKTKLESEKERIEQEIKSIEGIIPSVQGQINLYQSRVNYYKKKGCKSSDIIGVTCDVPKKVTTGGNRNNNGSNVGTGPLINGSFRFPVDGGSISWGYGGAHKGIDITKNRTCGAQIHPIAAGRVYYVGNTLDVYGAYMVIIVHNINGRLAFSQYAHVQPNIPVGVGQDVDINSTIAYMGTTGYSTGCHLHLETSWDKGWGYNASYSQYIKHIVSPYSIGVPKP